MRHAVRPVRHKIHRQSDTSVFVGDSEEEEVISQSQTTNAKRIHEDQDFVDKVSEKDSQLHSPKKQKVACDTKTRNASSEGKLKKAVRKVNEQAHANYCKLKIKNKNSKGNGRSWRRRKG
jgi:DNA replication regulator SLD2